MSLDGRRSRRFFPARLASAIVVLIAIGAGASGADDQPETDTRPAPRSFDSFLFDPETIDGGYAELGGAYQREDRSRFDIELWTAFGRFAVGDPRFEVGVEIPYRWLDRRICYGGTYCYDDDDTALADVPVYVKAIPLQGALGSAGGGLMLTIPSKDQPIGSDEVSFTPFLTGALRYAGAELRAYIGYQAYTDSPPDDNLLFGGGLFYSLGDAIGLRAEFVGAVIDPGPGGSGIETASFVPGVDWRLSLGAVDVLLRPTGSVGLNDDSFDWGAAFSIALEAAVPK